ATNTSAPAAGGLSRCVKINGGGFTSAEGGFAERLEAHSFRHRGVSEADLGAEPRAIGDILRRVYRHLRRDVPMSRNIALDEFAAMCGRRRVPCPHLHHPA